MIYQVLELAINNALEHDPSAKQKVAAMSGKTVQLEIKNIPQRISISLQEHGVEVSAGVGEVSDVQLRASISALNLIARHGMEEADLQPGDLEIHGDPIVGQKFAKIIAEIDVDWDDLLAEHLGEGPARVVSFGLSQAKEMASQGKELVKQRINDLVKNDLELLADHNQVEVFLEGVDNLRADTDRLAARIQRLKAQL